MFSKRTIKAFFRQTQLQNHRQKGFNRGALHSEIL